MDRDEARAGAQTAAQEIARLRQELIAVGARQNAGDKTLAQKGSRLAALNAAEADLSARMGRNQSALSRLLGALEVYGKDPPPALLVSPHNAVDAVNAAILMNAIAPSLEQKAASFSRELHELQGLRRRVLLADQDVFAVESEAGERRADIRRLIAQKTALQTRLTQGADGADADVRRLARQARALGELVQGLESSGGPAAGEGLLGLIAPAPGAPVRRFKDPWPGQARSEGWSWRVGAGQSVRAPADGRVDYAGPLKGWGLVVILRVSDGYHLVLAGLGSASVPVGGAVTAGEPIGRMAGSGALSKDGRGAPSELYLEVRKGETPVDPARWLTRTTARGGH
jgi:septal ring factor EnvC (AmiA/AmiB activator)